MLLKYVENYKSIENPFNDVALPDFVVMTGKNGSGKTHLLTGIKEGKVNVDNISPKDILYLNYLSFAQNFQTKTNRGEGLTAWERFNTGTGGDILFQLKAQTGLLEPFKAAIEAAALEKDKPILSLTIDDLESQTGKEIGESIYRSIQTVKTNLSNLLDNGQYVNDHIAHSAVESVIKKSRLFPTSITESDFYKMFQKTVFGNSKILTDLSNVFFEYYKNIDRNERNERKKLPFFNQTEFVKKFGPPPWELVRNIFIGFGLNFDINDPEQDNTDPLDGSFAIIFKNNDRGGRVVAFNDLSSGEQILITLINAIYTANRTEGLPKLLLLDEIDSPLNPSVIDKFISYIKDNFLTNGVKVVIATHSPSTVAFAPDNAVYLVNTRKSEPLVATANNDAIDALSEGFITLSDVMNFEKIPESKIIISEGKNYRYLSKAKEIYAAQDNDLKVLRLNIGGTSQLRTLFEFMRNFNSSKTFIFVFDCDYRYKEVRDETTGAFVKNQAGEQQYEDRSLSPISANVNPNNRVFIFAENNTSQSKRGVENLFDTSSTTGYIGEFDEKTPKNKPGFEKYILGRQQNDDFINFRPLFDFISLETKNANF